MFAHFLFCIYLTNDKTLIFLLKDALLKALEGVAE
jgi:hypothetical protein